MKKAAQDAGNTADTEVVVTDQDFDDVWDAADKQDMAGKTDTLDKDNLDNDDDLDGEDPNDAGAAKAAPAKKADIDANADIDAGADEETDFDEAKLNEEVSKLQQKIRSAEGRLAKQENENLRASVAAMKGDIQRLQEMQKSIAPPDKADPKAKTTADKKTGDDEIVPEGFTKEDWATYQEDYPDYAKGLLSQEKARRRDLANAQQRIEKIEKADTDKQQEAARKEFNAGIIKAHPDYEQIETQEADKVLAFIEAQEDPIEQEVLRSIVERGSQQQIIGLIGRYKVWRDGEKPSADKQTTNTQTNDTTKKRIVGATAVPGRGGSRPDLNKPGAPDKNDFDGAWEQLEKAGR